MLNASSNVGAQGLGASGVPLLTYHELTNRPSRDLYAVSQDVFAEHIDFLRSSTRVGDLPDAAHITFDDGHSSNVSLAAPTLDRHAMKAIFFITSGWTGVRINMMRWSDLALLVRKGHSIQSHGWSHKFLTHCSARELNHELVASKSTLEQHLGTAVNSISLPGGRWDHNVIRACAAAGYEHVYTSDPLYRPVFSENVWLHGRMMVHRDSSVGDLRRFLLGDVELWERLRRRHNTKKFCKRLLGDRLYNVLWQRLAAREAHDEDSFLCEKRPESGA